MKNKTLIRRLLFGPLTVLVILLLINVGYRVYKEYSTDAENVSATEITQNIEDATHNTEPTNAVTFDLSAIPMYTDSPYCTVNNNYPFFHADELVSETYYRFSDLDSLGRCGVATACVGIDGFPIEERGYIGMVKPSGWHTVRYDDLIKDKYLYNRCHLIAYSLSGENANEKNLITGTRYLNIEGMLPFENQVHNYIEDTGNHVMYRVTPIYDGDNLVASGVLMEGYSVEDSGEGICFNVFCYNAQPHIVIDYKDGSSRADTGS